MLGLAEFGRDDYVWLGDGFARLGYCRLHILREPALQCYGDLLQDAVTTADLLALVPAASAFILSWLYHLSPFSLLSSAGSQSQSPDLKQSSCRFRGCAVRAGKKEGLKDETSAKQS